MKRRTPTKGGGGQDPRTGELKLGGSFLAGSAADIPDGFSRLVRNMVFRPNRIASRPPFVYDSLMGITSLMTWADLKNQQTRFLALDTSRNLYQKATTGETWSGAVTGTATANRVTDFANYRGKLYYMLDDGAGNPAAAAVYDGSAISASPFNSAIFARTVTTFIDRLFLAYPRVTVVNAFNSAQPLTNAYDLTGSDWTKTNVTAQNFTSGGVTTCRLFPTSTTASSVLFKSSTPDLGAITPAIAPSDALRFVVWKAGLKNTHPTFDMPITLEWYVTNSRANNSSHVVGFLISDGTNLQRVTVAGFAGAGAPTWATTVGATTVDGGITWINEGSAIIASTEDVIPNATVASKPTIFDLRATVPASTSDVYVSIRCKFFNSSTPTITLAPIDVSAKDGLADGDPAKANFGQQVTRGDFLFPFFNQESSATATINLESIIWSETSDAKTIRGANFFEPKEAAGLPTAACILSGRYVMMKRRSHWIFKGTSDPDNPILPESPANIEIGCLGPRAWDIIGDELFFIGENEVYRMRIGGYPIPICGDAMFEAIMDKGAGWVESQATYNMPLLSIDKKHGDVWVYTQKGKLYCFHIGSGGAPSSSAALYSATPAGRWTVHDVSNNAEVADLNYNTVTQEMYAAFGGNGLTRLDPSVTAKDTIESTLTLLPVTKDIVTKSIELFAPRYELCLHEIGIFHLATLAQTNEALYAYYSRDRGVTFPTFAEVRFDPAFSRIPIAGFQSGHSETPMIRHVGQAGEAIWSVTKADMTLELLTGEWPFTQPTQIASAL